MDMKGRGMRYGMNMVVRLERHSLRLCMSGMGAILGVGGVLRVSAAADRHLGGSPQTELSHSMSVLGSM